MPPATRSHRGKAEHDGLERFDHTLSPSPRLHIQSAEIFSSQQQSNAKHHPPPRVIDVDESRRVGGRVHAVVRLRPIFSPLPPPPMRMTTSNLRHASRDPLQLR